MLNSDGGVEREEIATLSARNYFRIAAFTAVT